MRLEATLSKSLSKDRENVKLIVVPVYVVNFPPL